MKRLIFSAVLLLCVIPTQAAVRSWTNTLGGTWFATTNWSPNVVPGTVDIAVITNNGTYTVTVSSNSVLSPLLILGGHSGTQTLTYGVNTALTISNSVVPGNSSTIQTNGVLTLTNGGLRGQLTVAPGGVLNIASPVLLFHYASTLTNHGTVLWTNGSMQVGGGSGQTTTILNTGLFQATGDNSFNNGGGDPSHFLNSGVFRKIVGTGTTTFFGIDLVNLPGGLVDVQSGTLQLTAIQTNILGGTFNVVSPGQITMFNGAFTDAGGVLTGNGVMQFNNGNFYLRTNIIVGLKLIGGEVYITGTSTFQQAGAITNLTLDGSILHGTNRIGDGGTFNLNSGGIQNKLTVMSGGTFNAASGSSKSIYGLNLVNASGGIINVSNSMSLGNGTLISNGGQWNIIGDGLLSLGASGPVYFTNSHLVQKTGGTGKYSFSGVTFINNDPGYVQVNTGTIEFPNGFTNTGGTLFLNGGQFQCFPGALTQTSGSIGGNGTLAQHLILGGTLEVGAEGPGLINCPLGLNIQSNATLLIDGNGTTPGVSYDQINVTGTVIISNSTLNVTSLPNVPANTTFVIITNDGSDAVLGTFNGLPENAQLSVLGQSFRIHYAGGSGNDVTLVADSAAGPQLHAGSGSYSNGAFRLTGSGHFATVYTIQATTNFVQWTNIGTATSDGSGNFNFLDSNALQFHYRYYRTTN